MLHSINAFIGSHLLLKLLLLTVIVKCDSTKNQCNSYYHGHQSDHDFLLHNSRPFLVLISILFAFISQCPCERHSPYNIFLSYNIRTFLSINSDGFQPVSDRISQRILFVIFSGLDAYKIAVSLLICPSLYRLINDWSIDIIPLPVEE